MAVRFCRLSRPRACPFSDQGAHMDALFLLLRIRYYAYASLARRPTRDKAAA